MAAYQYPSSNLTFAQTVTKVAGDNKLANPNSISPGQTITLPDGSSVVVQRGDTLSGIVDKWKTNAEAQANATPAQVVTPPATITEPPPPVSEPKKDDENAPITEPPVKPSIPVSSNTGTMKISPDSIRANPLSAYSSSTYNISLYMINPDSFNLYSAGGNKIPKDWKLICRSGGINNAGEIVFENDGTGNGTGNPRADGFELDYYIDDLRISTAISSKETYSACNSFDFSFKVYEPYGFSFPTKLIKAATQVQAASKIQRSVNESITALQTQYLLVIKFYGYDNEGKVISTDDYERSFPIQICGFDFKLDPKMVVYNIKAKLSSEGMT